MEETKATNMTDEEKKPADESKIKDGIASEKKETEQSQTTVEKEAKEKFDKLKNLSEVLATATLKELNSLSNDKEKVDCLSKSMMSFFMFASLSVLP